MPLPSPTSFLRSAAQIQMESKLMGNNNVSSKGFSSFFCQRADLAFCWQASEHFTLPWKVLKAIYKFSAHIINRFSKQSLLKLPTIYRPGGHCVFSAGFSWEILPNNYKDHRDWGSSSVTINHWCLWQACHCTKKYVPEMTICWHRITSLNLVLGLEVQKCWSDQVQWISTAFAPHHPLAILLLTSPSLWRTTPSHTEGVQPTLTSSAEHITWV